MAKIEKLTPALLDRLIREQVDKLLDIPDEDKFIDIEKDEKSNQSSDGDISDELIGIQQKYMLFVNSLTPDERKQVKQLFCYDAFTVKQLRVLALAQKGKEPEVQERKYRVRTIIKK